MWLMTVYGFFSVTQSEKEPDKFKVRARRKEHLEKLSRAFKQLRRFEIHDSPKLDYRWRIYVPRETWKKVVAQLIDQTQFSNFKNAAKKFGGDDRYLHALSKTWSTFADIQESPPYGMGALRLTPQQQAVRSFTECDLLECLECGDLYPADGGACFCGAMVSQAQSVVN